MNCARRNPMTGWRDKLDTADLDHQDQVDLPDVLDSLDSEVLRDHGVLKAQ